MGKPHIVLRWDCPRHNGYVTWDYQRDREVYTIHPLDVRLARSMMMAHDQQRRLEQAYKGPLIAFKA